MTTTELAEKVRRLEHEVAQLRAQMNGQSDRWWVEQAGRFANDKEFKKIVRLGRSYRKGLKPKPKA